MFPDPISKIWGDTYVEGAISLARQDVYGRLLIHYPRPFYWIPAKGMPE